jgi:hypothetical protein
VNATADGVAIDDTTANVLTGSLARTAGETVAGGPYVITQGTLAAGDNYMIHFTGSTLIITPATLSITAQPETKVYGSADPTWAFTSSGFQFSDTATTVLTGSLARAAGETVSGSPYAIGQGTLTSSSNYTIAFTGSTLTITPATPVLTVSSSGGTFTGSPMAVQATVTGVDGTPTSKLEGAAPKLTYYVGTGTSGTDLGAAPLSSPGTYTVVASFPATADYAVVRSRQITFVIARGAPMIALNASGSSAVYEQAVTFVATVSGGGGDPGGTVTFSDGATPLATVALNGSGRAALTTTSLAVGSHAITASYSGDADFLGISSKTAPESVTRASTQIALTPHPVFRKKKVVSLSLTAAVQPIAPAGGLPTGVVTFETVVKKKKKMQAKVLGTAALSDGRATLPVKSKQVLNTVIEIVYTGDENDIGSTLTPPKLTQSALKSLARPMLAFCTRGTTRS